MKFSRIALVPLCAFVALAAAPRAFAIDGRQVMQNAFDVKEPKFSHSLVQMDLIEKDGTVESRVIEEWGKEAGDLKSVLMAFHTPASVKGTRFLQVENSGRADDKWIYLPALKAVRRIASSEGDKSFMGSDATYDDMSSREVEEDTHELLGEESFGGFSCYKIKSVPKDPTASQYSYRIALIDKATWVPVKVQMFDKKQQLLKELVVERLEETGGYWIPRQNTLKNVQTGHSTRLVINKIEVDTVIDDRVFSTNFLSQGR
jgi:outer membrane lipoprotein-sorting protein